MHANSKVKISHTFFFCHISHLRMLAVQNLGLGVFAIVANVIKEAFGYIYLEITFLIVLYFAFITGM